MAFETYTAAAPGTFSADEQKVAFNTLHKQCKDLGLTQRQPGQQYGDVCDGINDDATLMRFLKGREFDPEGALKQYQEAIVIRNDNQVIKAYDTISVQDFEQAREVYPHWSGRRDKRGLPIYMFDVALLSSEVIAKYNSRQAAANRTKNALVFHDYLTRFVIPLCASLPDCKLQGSSGMSSILNAPIYFGQIWGLMSKLIDPRTASKLVIVPSGRALSTLAARIDIESLPTEYGGEFDYIPGRPPKLDQVILDHLDWKLSGDRLPEGPIKWGEDQHGRRLVLATGHANGKLRSEQLKQVPMAQTRNIVVTGATGNQGGGVVRALLASNQDWHVRALTRDLTSSRAQSLSNEFSQEILAGRLELYQGDASDLNSLVAAFTGAHGVFAVTQDVTTGNTVVNEQVEAGRNMVLAAKETGVKHFVFSSLPDMDKATGGRFPGINHMNNKYAIEMIAREHLDGVTCLIPGFFYTNLKWPHYAKRRADGVVVFKTAFPSDQVAEWTDPSYDMGIFATRVFELGVDKTASKTYLVLSPSVTPKEMAEAFTKVTGQPSVHVPITPEEFGEATVQYAGPDFRLDAQKMMQWASIAPADKVCYGALDPKMMDETFKELGIKASTFEDWLQRSGWKGPE
ncbi:cinnamoyl reductase [Fusarium heterosporum]|uniref:Cinnamoyl reductase n=1 Tax=Fusarium heterosporum TaxID=42747 RepID=A0A8H5TU25_FUSHE|nr:cinnamoyl reductase [Fusarium heterosporum]